MDYNSTPEFDDKFLKLTQKNKALEARFLKKIRQILDNPSIGAPKHHALKHARGSHVDPYVIIYVLKDDIITFLYIDHHDFVYEKAVKIMAKWEREIED
jgi:mRNA-degrading endonuclease RelE of RelBE toxin-antitoxin system